MMNKNTLCSIVIPVYNEEKTIEQALDNLNQQKYSNSSELVRKDVFEIIIVDNNSTDNTVSKITRFSKENPDIRIIVIKEKNQGVAWARKSGMDLAVKRSKDRDNNYHINKDFYIASTDADCYVDPHWLDEQISALQTSDAALCVSHYYYPMEHFHNRPNLSRTINLIMKSRDIVMRIFGGFPDGKGFAIRRDKYEKVNGIEIFYQLSNGKFVCHLSDDWDFGIKVRASGENIIYNPNARVQTNPRRVDHALHEMIQGKAYGANGIITMSDIRPSMQSTREDLSEAESQLLFDYSIKDFTTKHIILPILLTPTLLDDAAVNQFLSSSLCEQLHVRINQIMEEMRMKDFTPIHSYKTPCFRLYFEFKKPIFERMRIKISSDIGYPPPPPTCLNEILDNQPDRFKEYVYYYCEDRESGEAHNYFGNGGVF